MGFLLGQARRPQTHFDRRRSIERRRRLAFSGPLPAALAAGFTVSELAALRIIGDEVRDRGSCSLYVEEIAARSGTSRSTVKNAMREAQRRGLLLRSSGDAPARLR